MSNTTITIVTLVAFFAVCSGCGKNSNDSGVTSPAGGKGGNAVLFIIPTHHGQYIDSCTIYLKYASNDAPANGMYDDSAMCVVKDSLPVATFTGLKAGAYYLYAQGFHGGYVPPYVKGGLPHNITADAAKDSVLLPTYSYNK